MGKWDGMNIPIMLGVLPNSFRIDQQNRKPVVIYLPARARLSLPPETESQSETSPPNLSPPVYNPKPLILIILPKLLSSGVD
jgi:hypothetical protein